MNKKVLSIVFVLIIIVGGFAMLNAGDREDRINSQQDALLYVTREDERIATLTFEDIENLEEYEFDMVLRSSNNADQDITYTGVRMKDLLQSAGVDLDEMEQVISKAVDGYTVALSAGEVLVENNVYIAYKNDGKYMKTKEEGGSGPYQVIIIEDEFGQRWNKFLMELEIR